MNRHAGLSWLKAADGTSYPPEPWYLGGNFLLSVFRLPVSRLPAAAFEAIPADHSLVTVAGRATVGVTFVHYSAGGVLAYEELLVALLVRKGARLRSTIPDIWVSSQSSMHGGRELWGIPKQLGDFTRDNDWPRCCSTMNIAGEAVAKLDARIGRPILPGLWQVPQTTAQLLDGRRIVAKNRIVGRLRGMRGEWSITPDGPLDYLAKAKPFLSVAITDSAVIFGTRVERP